jgi:hypothetical protein
MEITTIQSRINEMFTSGGRTIAVNGRALCGLCHKIITHESKLKEVDKKRKSNIEPLRLHPLNSH